VTVYHSPGNRFFYGADRMTGLGDGQSFKDLAIYRHNLHAHNRSGYLVSGTVLHWFFPLETLIVAIAIAVITYLGVRGLVNLLARSKKGSCPPEDKK
jgi:hypothetical protein